MVCLIYDGLHIPKLGKFNYLRASEFVSHYDVAVRFKNNRITSDELRSYIAGLNPEIDLPLDLTPLIRESIVDGSLGLINTNVNKLLTLKEKFLDNLFPDHDKNSLSSFPLINALYNFIENALNRVKSISNIEDPVEVLDKLSGIVLPDLDALVLERRDVSTRVAILDKVWRGSINSIKKRSHEDMIFGSSIQTTES